MKPDGTPTPFVSSFRYAARGIVQAYRLGLNIRVQTVVALVVVLAGVLCALSPVEWCLIVLCIGAVLAAECLNTALEQAIDLSCPHFDEQAGVAKDLAAGAVLALSIASCIIGLLVFIPHIISFFC